MGMNFYLKSSAGAAFEDGRHIGKSSAGWNFALRVYQPDPGDDGRPDGYPRDLFDWIRLFNDANFVIHDESDKVVAPETMLGKILLRKPYGRDFLLRKHTLGTNGCILHGDGTFDLFVEEFS